jgi:hypothetical protein
MSDPEKTVDAEAVAAAMKAEHAAKRQRQIEEAAVKAPALKSILPILPFKRPDEKPKADQKSKGNGAAKDEEPKADRKSKDEKLKGATTDLSLKGRAFSPHALSLEKTIAALRTLGIQFSYDKFRRRYRVGDHDLDERFGDSIDGKILVLRTAIMERFSFDPRDFIAPAVFRLCLENAFHPILDYLDRLEWDRKPRLDTWLTTYLSAAPNNLNRRFGRKTLIAGVRRVRKPGTKFDQAMILEGEQDTGKSTTLKILAGDDFHEDAEIISKSGREVQELTSGVWIYEISELVGLGKREVEHVKNFLSATHDTARPSYGRVVVDQPRTCIFVGTCNRNDYLTDDTGNRRFWISCGPKRISLRTRARH